MSQTLTELPPAPRPASTAEASTATNLAPSPAASAERSTAGCEPSAGWYYGWLMLPMAIAVQVASSPGQTFGVSIFNESMRLGLHLTHGQLAAAYMLGTLLGAIPITFIGSAMDRYGLRRTMLVVVSLFSAACLLTSLVQSWLALVAAFCLLRMLGPGALSFLSGNTLAFWFDRRLGTVEGLRQVGMAGAMVLIPAVNLWLVAHYGWRGAYALLGSGIWLILFPLIALLFRNHPEEVGQQIDGRVAEQLQVRGGRCWWGLTLHQVLRTRTFWILTLGAAVFGAIHTAVFFCLVPIFQERGLTQQHAAATLTTFALCLAAMQLAGGMLADRIRPPLLLCTGMLGLGLSMLLLHAARGPGWGLLFAVAMGTAQGLYFGAAQPLWARYFGRRHLGKIRGVLMTANVACSSVGPLLAGLTRDLTGEFSLALMLFAAVSLPLALLGLLAAPPPRD